MEKVRQNIEFKYFLWNKISENVYSHTNKSIGIESVYIQYREMNLCYVKQKIHAKQIVSKLVVNQFLFLKTL